MEKRILSDDAAKEIITEWLMGSSSEESDDICLDTSTSDEEKQQQKRCCIKYFIEETVFSYSDQEFKGHFRLSRKVVYALIEKFESFIHFEDTFETNITHKKAFLLTLWYLANSETFRQIADRFDLSLSSSHKVLCKTLNFIISLQQRYLKWPNEQESKEICQQFKSQYHVNGIIGAIDGCHIRIRKPAKCEEDYVNRKGFHSILLQGVCDYRKLFIDVHIGESGSLHDARVLKKSPLYRIAQEDLNFFHGCFLLGDSAYPNLKWLAPPFKNYGQLTENQILFNIRHSSARSVIEHAFGLLKCRFRRLFYFYNLRTDLIIKCVMAACILHNICILSDSNDPEMQNVNSAYQELNARERIFFEMFC